MDDHCDETVDPSTLLLFPGGATTVGACLVVHEDVFQASVQTMVGIMKAGRNHVQSINDRLIGFTTRAQM